MPLDRIMLILACIAGALVLCFWAFGAVFAAQAIHPALTILIVLVIGFVVYVIWRLLAERLNNTDEDHYDNMDH